MMFKKNNKIVAEQKVEKQDRGLFRNKPEYNPER